MIHTLKMWEDPVLRDICIPVNKVDEKIALLLDEMAETMYENNGGGLAANQIGILLRMVVIDVGDGLLKLVNPEIIAAEGTQLVEEGCLSFPGVWGKVQRPQRVTVQALDEHGTPFLVQGEDLLAQCLCHEIDHLNGSVFTDHVIEYIKE